MEEENIPAAAVVAVPTLLERLLRVKPAQTPAPRLGGREIVQKPGRSLPVGAQYIGRCGPKAQTRYLKQRWAQIEKLCRTNGKAGAALEAAKAAVAARERLLDCVADEPNPEFSAMHLGHSALLAAEGTHSEWAAAMHVLLNKFPPRAEPEPEEKAATEENERAVSKGTEERGRNADP